MVRHNNMIPNNHFHKKWQRRVRTWFDQPMRKLRRRTVRTKKMLRVAPGPVEVLRPLVHCPSVRYNNKLRPGRGFTLRELKTAKINPRYARTIGIGVDSRRYNRCMESIASNVKRLKEYLARLILLHAKRVSQVQTDRGKNLNNARGNDEKIKARIVSEEEKKFQAFLTLRRVRADSKYKGVRLRRKTAKGDAFDKSVN